jgi:[ribosomal protein S18]-alanine N-acetyltransferase
VRVRVRHFEPLDLPACLDLFAAVCAEGLWLATEAPIDRRVIRRRWEALQSTGDGALLLAERARGCPPAGLVALVGRCRPELGMVVDSACRGAGVGDALVRAALEWARRAGAPEVVLHVFTHNAGAIALYRKHGFEQRGTLLRAYPRRSGERWDAHRMVKPLALLPAASPPPSR